MASTRKFNLGKCEVISGNIKVDVNFRRLEDNLQVAQYELDGDVMNSMVSFMPHYNGTFIQQTRLASAAVQGSGLVYAAYGIQGRYLYEGKVMVDSETGKGPRKIPTGPGEYVLRFRKGSHLVATDRALQYTKTHNPDATDHLFDAAKKRDGQEWIKKVKKNAGRK